MRRLALVAAVVVAACGAAPDKPLLANAPQPNPGAVAGVAAAAAAAVTLASPDSARTPEKATDVEKKPITVKEHVPGDVLDRLDHAPPADTTSSAREPGETKTPPPPVDYGLLKGPLTKHE